MLPPESPTPHPFLRRWRATCLTILLLWLVLHLLLGLSFLTVSSVGRFTLMPLFWLAYWPVLLFEHIYPLPIHWEGSGGHWWFVRLCISLAAWLILATALAAIPRPRKTTLPPP